MTKAELKKKTKSELFKLEARLSKRRVTEKSKEELSKEKAMVKHVLYECDYCMHAVTNVVEGKNGEEAEYFISDCRDKICRYRDDFLRMAEQEKKKIDEIMRIV